MQCVHLGSTHYMIIIKTGSVNFINIYLLYIYYAAELMNVCICVMIIRLIDKNHTFNCCTYHIIINCWSAFINYYCRKIFLIFLRRNIAIQFFYMCHEKMYLLNQKIFKRKTMPRHFGLDVCLDLSATTQSIIFQSFFPQNYRRSFPSHPGVTNEVLTKQGNSSWFSSPLGTSFLNT